MCLCRRWGERVAYESSVPLDLDLAIGMNFKGQRGKVILFASLSYLVFLGFVLEVIEGR